MLGTDFEPEAEDPAFELLSRAVRAAFRDLTAGRFSQSELSQGLGSAPNRLGRFLSGKRGLSVDESLRLLGITRTDPALFLQLVAARLPHPGPAETVQQLCLSPDAEPEPFLLELESLLSETLEPVPDHGSRLAEIEELDELRFAGALAARDKVELVCRELACEAAAAPESGRALRELVRAIGLWATISRTLGERSAAARAFVLGFTLATSHNDLEGIALLRIRVSYLLMDAGHAHFALQFLNEAAEYFLINHDEEQFARCLVDRGVVLMKSNQDAAAEKVLLKALEGPPTLTSSLHRVAANQWLAIRAERQQDEAEARRRLAMAIEECNGRRDSVVGQLAWSAGRLAIQAGEFLAADQHLTDAMRILFDTGQPFEGELVLLDIAESRLKRGMLKELRECGLEVLARLSKNSHSRLATSTLIKFGNQLRWGTPDVADIAEARARLKEAGRALPPPALNFA